MDKSDEIYILTVMEDIATGRQMFNKRVLGWYPTKEDAVRAVEEDKEGMRDCLYDYVIIEGRVSGAYTKSTAEIWFKWDYDGEKYVPFEKPYEFRMFSNFGMG